MGRVAALVLDRQGAGAGAGAGAGDRESWELDTGVWAERGERRSASQAPQALRDLPCEREARAWGRRGQVCEGS